MSLFFANSSSLSRDSAINELLKSSNIHSMVCNVILFTLYAMFRQKRVFVGVSLRFFPLPLPLPFAYSRVYLVI
jgi:hypothetical protein